MKASKDELDRMSEIVYEAITGKCYHSGVRILHTLEIPIIGHIGREWYWCPKCGRCLPREDWGNNPPLATSLDAWAEHIWPVIKTKGETVEHMYWQENYETALWKALGIPDDCDPGGGHEGGPYSTEHIWGILAEATPLHHLEAALRMLNKWDEGRESCGE